MIRWQQLADDCLAHGTIGREDALDILRAPDEDLLALITATERVRRHHFGNEVQLHVLANVRSGLCSEDCAFCAQSGEASTPLERFETRSVEEIIAAARKARDAGAYRFCMVASGRTAEPWQQDRLCEAVQAICTELRMRVCVSAGLLDAGLASRLRDVGADRYNHNLETSRRMFPSICTTHGYDDRVRTIEAAHEAGLDTCCGGIVGLGEQPRDLVDLAFELHRLGVASIPINFLVARPGTRLERKAPVEPRFGLKALCMFRMVNPTRDLRVAAGREAVLRSLQPLALSVCNSLFTEGYLTIGGERVDRDREMVRDAGFVPVTDAGSRAHLDIHNASPSP